MRFNYSYTLVKDMEKKSGIAFSQSHLFTIQFLMAFYR